MTKRFAWLLGAVVLTVAACGDDGNSPTGMNRCGDGDLGGFETCDDGNVASGDGCSAGCKLETEGVCGDATISLDEECDDGNTVDNDGCSMTCEIETTEPDCGNGALDGTEACDDGNGTSSDGCTACAVDTGYQCAGAPSVCSVIATANGTCAAPFNLSFAAVSGVQTAHAIGDTTTSTNQYAAGTCSGQADTGGGKDHTYKFVLTQTSDVQIYGPDKTAFDMVLRLTTQACTATTEVAEFTGADGCSDGDPEFLFYVALPAGTYYLDVDGLDATEFGAYDVTIEMQPTACGDGAVDDFEECDDGDTMGGDGCNARCEPELGFVCDDAEPSVCTVSCGNGDIDGGNEECDDGALVSGDGCSATCKLEYDILEVEPNNTTPQAIATPADQETFVKGALTAADVDLYSFTLTAPSYVDVETYNAIDSVADYAGVGVSDYFDCYNNANTKLFLYANGANYATDAAALFTDDDDGDLACSYVGSEDAAGNANEGLLQAGTYVIRVQAVAAMPRYILSVTVTPAFTPIAGELVLNEFMADPGTAADTNCDGTGSGTNDEFVELVNDSNFFLNLTGVTVADSLAVQYTFAAAATGRLGLLPGESVVVWGGGAPACVGVNNWFKKSGGFGFNAPADSVIVKAPGAAGATLVNQPYTSAGAGISWNLDPDVTGTVFRLHNAITGSSSNFSPGKRVNGAAFLP